MAGNGFFWGHRRAGKGQKPTFERPWFREFLARLEALEGAERPPVQYHPSSIPPWIVLGG